MTERPRFFDDLAGMAGGAISVIAGLRQEAEALARTAVDDALRRLDLVRREEVDALSDQLTRPGLRRRRQQPQRRTSWHGLPCSRRALPRWRPGRTTRETDACDTGRDACTFPRCIIGGVIRSVSGEPGFPRGSSFGLRQMGDPSVSITRKLLRHSDQPVGPDGADHLRQRLAVRPAQRLRDGRGSTRTVVRLRTLLQLVARIPSPPFHLCVRPQGSGKAAWRAV